MDAAKERVNVLFLSFVSSKWRKIITPIAAIAVISAVLFLPKGQADNNAFVMSEQNPFPELIEEPSEEVDRNRLSLLSPLLLLWT